MECWLKGESDERIDNLASSLLGVLLAIGVEGTMVGENYGGSSFHDFGIQFLIAFVRRHLAR